MTQAALPRPPQSWSTLTWTQLCLCWQTKMRYAGRPDVARPATLMALLSLEAGSGEADAHTGEKHYRLRGKDGRPWIVTPRELSALAREALPWLDYPYGDGGEPPVTDDRGKVIKEARPAVPGYVSPMRDAMVLPRETVAVRCGLWCKRVFQMPQAACINLTWQQYRSLQAIVPQLFGEGLNRRDVVALQAKFLAHALVPRSLALFDTAAGSIRLRPHREFRYNAEQADGLEQWFERRLLREKPGQGRVRADGAPLSVIFHTVFQCYQTAMTYYAATYPALFGGGGKNNKLQDALAGEVSVINRVMKYAGYAEQQQVYDSNLPFVFEILDTMTREAKEIEKMNAKMKRKR